MKKTIAGALLAGSIAATGLAAGVAQADSFVLADVAAPVFDPPPPPPPPPSPEPPHPFCTPRGGLFIVGPICDEIGVHR